jgi:putative ABC transport system permease protein
MLRATLKSLLSRKLRLILSGLAVVLGVMFVSGAFVLTDSIGRSFTTLFDGIYANVAVRVTPAPNLTDQGTGGGPNESGDTFITQSTVDKIKGVSGVASVNPGVVTDGVHVVGSDGKVVPSVGPPRLGVDWPSHAGNVVLRQGRGPTADNEVAINAGLAKTAGLSVGQQVRIRAIKGDYQTYDLVGTFGYPDGSDSLGGAQMVAFTLPVSQNLMLLQPNVFSQVTVTAASGVSNDQLRDNIAAALGPQFQVKTGAQLAQDAANQFTQALKFINYVLIGFAAVALFVAIFLILNTFSIIIAQRTRELALMRAIGADRGQVIRSVLIEAVVIGLLSSVIGLALGFGVGAALTAAFTATLAGGGLTLSLGLPAASVISAFVVGVGITVIAALIPAIRAARIPPVAALRESAAADRPLTRLTITGGAVFAVGAVLLTLGLTGAGGNTLLLILGGVLLTFVGTALLTPLFARPVAGLIGRLFAWSVPGQLGRLNAGRNPRRTAITAAALMVGIALITGINTVITSATASIAKVANSQAHVDLLISGDQGATFAPSVLTQAAQVNGVQAVSGLYGDVALVNGELTSVEAFSNMAVVPSMFSLAPTAGNISTVDDGQVIVDQKTATAKNLHVGSPVTVQLARGNPVHLAVSGIFDNADLINGYIVPQSLVSDFHIPSPALGFIQVKPGASVDSVKASVSPLVADNPEVSVIDRAQYLNQQANQANGFLVAIQILLALAILIAVLGVINTLALSVIERTREIGLLRAVGLRRGQTMRMITVESIVISVFGAVLGLAVGLGLGAAVVRALHDQGISQFAVPWGQLITYLILAAIVGVVAGVLPAIRAARVNVLEAIAYE